MGHSLESHPGNLFYLSFFLGVATSQLWLANNHALGFIHRIAEGFYFSFLYTLITIYGVASAAYVILNDINTCMPSIVAVCV